MLRGGWWVWQKFVSLPSARVSRQEPLRIQLCSLIRACTYSRMLHLLASLVLFCLSHPLWLVDVATRVLWKLSQKGRKVERVGGKFRGEQPRFRLFTGTRLPPPFLPRATRLTLDTRISRSVLTFFSLFFFFNTNSPVSIWSVPEMLSCCTHVGGRFN